MILYVHVLTASDFTCQFVLCDHMVFVFLNL